MNGPVKYSRLKHFLEAYGPLDERVEKLIYDRAHRAGYGMEDPLSMQIAHDTIMESRMRGFLSNVKRVPAMLRKEMEACIKSMQAAQARVDAESARKVADYIAREAARSLESSLPRLEEQLAAGARSKNRRARILMIAACLILVAACAAAGFVMGRGVTSGLASEYAILAAEPDAATWHILQRSNENLDQLIQKNCNPGGDGYINHSSGKKACSVPLWLEETAPRSISVLARGWETIASWWSGLRLDLRVFASFALALVAILAVLQVRAWMCSQNEQ